MVKKENPKVFKNRYAYEGKVFESKKCGKFKVVRYTNNHDVDIEFIDTGFTRNVCLDEVKTGKLYDPLFKRYFNRGFLGIGEYNCYSSIFHIWHSMLSRCYDEIRLLEDPSYVGCEVCEDWFDFQNYARWYSDNHPKRVINRYNVDKDLLIKNNKLYSPETCCFLPHDLNKALIGTQLTRKTSQPVGVTIRKGLICANIKLYGKTKYLGCFKSINEAKLAYNKAKKGYIRELAKKHKSTLTKETYNALLNFKVD